MQSMSVVASSQAAAVSQRLASSKKLSPAISRPAAARKAVRVRAEGEAAAPGLETKGQNFEALKDIQEIMNILPHR